MYKALAKSFAKRLACEHNNVTSFAGTCTCESCGLVTRRKGQTGKIPLGWAEYNLMTDMMETLAKTFNDLDKIVADVECLAEELRQTNHKLYTEISPALSHIDLESESNKEE